MEQFTPRALHDLFILLPDDSKRVFLEMIASEISTESIFLMTAKLDPVEQKRFSDILFRQLLWQHFPMLQREARKLARAQPQISDEEFDRLFNEQIKVATETHETAIHDLVESQIKQQRNRKSDPETIKRNVEICELRRQDRKKWSQGKLARKYDLTTRAIRKILKDESRWRKLLNCIGTN